MDCDKQGKLAVSVWIVISLWDKYSRSVTVILHGIGS